MRTAMTLLLATIFALPPAIAQVPSDHTAHHTAPTATVSAAPMSEGEVRKVDKDAGKITLRHGPIPSLDMPPMTMVFRTADPAMLDRVKAGDKVRFTADKVGGQYTVTSIETVK